MIQLLLMLLGLAFGNNNGNTTWDNNNGTITALDSGGSGSDPGTGINPGDTGGETGQIPPPKKK